MSSRTILIIDDCIVFLKAMSMKLRSHGYDVVTAVDGAAAVSAIRQLKPDLVLLDLNFPPDVAHGGGVSWNGFLILNWIRRMDDGKDVPIIIISATEVTTQREQLRADGVVDFFLKPVDHEEVSAAIQQALLKRPLRPDPAPAAQCNRKILFVDDESDWRHMATLYLAECGYEVITAADATQALKKASEFLPDLIVLDFKLGDESGETLMKLLTVTYPQTPILVYTGQELSDAEAKELQDQGAYRYLHKATMEDLLHGVSEAMSEPVPAPETAEPVPCIEDEPHQSSAESALILEDDIGFGDSLLLFLEAQGFAVTRVTDGAEGLRQIMATDFNYIICDMVMPNMPGEQFYHAVEEYKLELCKRFIFMSGHQADPRSDIFIRRVHALMLWKPFPLGDLLTATQIVRRRSQETMIRPKETRRQNSGPLRMGPH